MKIRFVVDSGCDVPPDMVRKHGMFIVPLFVNYAGESYADDNVQLVREDYYHKLPHLQPIPKTSAASVGGTTEVIRQALDAADHVICVSIAGDLSNSHNVVRLAAESLESDRVTMWDSETLSMGGGWQAIIGAEVAAETGDLEAVLAAMGRVREAGMVYAAMVDMEYLRRGGRVGWAVATVGGMLRIRPIVRVKHGKVVVAARSRTRKAWVDKVIELTQAEGELDRLAFLHTNNLEDIDVLRDALAGRLPDTTITTLASPVIGTHTGPFGIGVATVRKTWKDG